MEIKTLFFVTLFVLGALSQDCCDKNTVKVSGNAEVKVKPDFATITIGAEATELKTAAALQSLNRKIDQLIKIIKAQKIDEKDYSTSSLTLTPVYDYQNGEGILTGQKASQTLSVKIRSLTADGANIGRLIDEASKINGLIVNGVTFDQSDRKLGVKQARKAAFEAAKKKADQYAALSGLRAYRVLRMSSLDGGDIIPYFANAAAFSGGNSKTLVPVRDVLVRANVDVWFSLIP